MIQIPNPIIQTIMMSVSTRRLGAVALLILSGCRQREVSSHTDTSASRTAVPATCVPSDSVLDPQVAFVVTGGSWQRGKESGGYRIVVRSAGFEHVSSRVTVEWLEANPDAGTFVRASVELETIPTGLYSIALPNVEQLDGRAELVLSGSHAYAYTERGWRFALGEPNVVRTISDSTP